MQTTVEETDRHKVKLTIQVPPEEFGKDLDRAYRRIAQQVRIPGFRKGKVPKQIIDTQVGREAVLGEFLEDSVPGYYRDALRENDLAPITEPDIDVEQLEDGKPLIFTATVEVRPRLRFEDADYKGIRVERPSVEATDEEVDRLVESLRDRFAELEPVGRPARSGDYVVIDLHGSVHAEEVPEATRTDYLYEVGSGEFGDKLDAELEGKRAGEILKLNDVLPERAGERAGQEVSFSVLVKEVKGKKLPEADDDFAKTASEFDTLDELKASLREQLLKNKERNADAAVRDRVLQELVDRTEVDLPETLIDEETEHRVVARARAGRAARDDARPAPPDAGVRRAAIPQRRPRPRRPRDHGGPRPRIRRARGGARGHRGGARSGDRAARGRARTRAEGGREEPRSVRTGRGIGR